MASGCNKDVNNNNNATADKPNASNNLKQAQQQKQQPIVSYKRDLVANTSLTFVPTSMQKLCNSNLPIGNSVQIHNTNSGMPRYVYDYHNFSQAKANCSACQTNAVLAGLQQHTTTKKNNNNNKNNNVYQVSAASGEQLQLLASCHRAANVRLKCPINNAACTHHSTPPPRNAVREHAHARVCVCVSVTTGRLQQQLTANNSSNNYKGSVCCLCLDRLLAYGLSATCFLLPTTTANTTNTQIYIGLAPKLALQQAGDKSIEPTQSAVAQRNQRATTITAAITSSNNSYSNHTNNKSNDSKH
ncbi:probable basic-leucine zipper transcription factor L [Bactrocera oleae]|uniref:probable basic-leucine zipper transcription factor L n=1 Tax=Bactrocera oleae TaxID=104688 RepID=UPI00387EE66F